MTSTGATSAPGARGDGGLRAWPLGGRPMTVLLVGALVAFAVWTAAGLIVVHLLDDGWLGGADRAVNEWFEQRRTSANEALSHAGSWLAETPVKVALVVLVGGAMVLRWRRWHDGVMLAVVVITEATVFLFVSLAVDRDRPPVEQLDAVPPTGSFPSGHVAAAVAFYGALPIVAGWHTRRAWVRVPLMTVAVVAPVIVAVSRVARGMHHPTDVVAGGLLGLASIALVHRVLQVGTADVDRRGRAGAELPDRVRRLDLSSEPGEPGGSGRRHEPVGPEPVARPSWRQDHVAPDADMTGADR